jgi:glucose/arabinose dehydrogenase
VLRTVLACTFGSLALTVTGCGAGSGMSTSPGARLRSGAGDKGIASATSFASVRVDVPGANARGAFASTHSLTIPRGWSAEVWALVPGARFMAWTPQHTLLVSVPYANEVVELVPRRDPAAPPEGRVLLTGLSMPQGLAFDTLDGRSVLYVAESDQIDRYVWRGAAGVGAHTVIVRGLPDADPRGDEVHRLKTLVVGADHRIYLNIGSAFNASTRDIAGKPPRASVVSYAPDGGARRVLATGVRNAEGLSFAPNGVLWGAVNERGDIPYPFHGSYDGVKNAYGRLFPNYVNSHPPDEIVALTPGRDVGWPYCNPDPGDGLVNPGWDDDAQNNAGGRAFDCAKIARINLGLPAHSAALGLNFLEGTKLPDGLSDGAVVAVHGSSDQQPLRPPAVLWMPWSASTNRLGSPITLVSGFQQANGSRWGRPVDALPGPAGSLYVSDDAAGAVYRITP